MLWAWPASLWHKGFWPAPEGINYQRFTLACSLEGSNITVAELSMLTSLGAFEGIHVLAPASGIGTLCLQTSLCLRPEAKNVPKLGSGGNP